MRIENESGELQSVTSLDGAEWLAADIPAPKMIFDGLIEEAAMTHVIVTPGWTCGVFR